MVENPSDMLLYYSEEVNKMRPEQFSDSRIPQSITRFPTSPIGEQTRASYHSIDKH